MEQYLDETLKAYDKKKIYPFHMPGHKRQDMGIREPERLDITEIEGFDNLHHAEGILKEAQERMADTFGADRSYYLVNGSTAGLLAAICATVPKGGRILIARNCHKAVYNGIFLRDLRAEYAYPEFTDFGIQGSIQPEQIEKELRVHPDIGAVLITSPTYDGVVSDIKTISGIVHRFGIPLIVDEAHGAHFGFSDGFPKKALALGADAAIESMHKTLPAYTQTAALHLKGERIRRTEIEKYLSIFQSSSPSYVFMAGLDRCTRTMAEHGRELLEQLEKRLQRFYKQMNTLKYLEVLSPDKAVQGIWEKDPSKILISGRRAGLSGQALYMRLLEEFGLQLEMASGHYVTALTSLMDTEEGFARLSDALKLLDGQLAQENGRYPDWQGLVRQLYRPAEKKMEIFQAEEAALCRVPLQEAVGKISGEFIYLYPPGIPFLVPGEVIGAELPRQLERLQAEGFVVQGPEDWSLQRIKVASSEKLHYT